MTLLSVCLEIWYKEILYRQMYHTIVYFEVCRFAARRRTEACEGGSWQLHNSDGWGREGLQSTRVTQEPMFILAHCPSNCAAGTRKLYRLYHQDTSKLFC